MVRRTSLLCGLALLVLLFAGAAPANAQQRACFAETGRCIGGRFAQYWEQNGGLAVFGYPLTDELTEGGRTVQYFERQRFELHTENAAPYDVLLGLLGEEVLQQRGIDWRTQPLSPGPIAGCLWFEQTQHNVCKQASNSGFKHYWQTHGLEFDGRVAKSYQVLLGQGQARRRAERQGLLRAQVRRVALERTHCAPLAECWRGVYNRRTSINV